MTEQDLLQGLRSFVVRTVGVAQSTTDRVLENSTDRHDRLVMLSWKMSLDSELRRLLDYRRPTDALTEIWVQMERSVNFADTTECRKLFGEHTAALKAFYISAELSLEDIAKDVFDAEQFVEAQAAIEQFAREHPMNLSDVRSASSTSGLSEAEATALEKIVSKPTKIIAYVVGVDDTAEAIHTVTAAADRISFMAAGMPQTARWEVERLLFAVDENETTKSLVADAHTLSETVAKLVETADALPAKLQRELSKTLDEIDIKQAGLRQTISQADDVVKSVDSALVKASTALHDFERSARALEAAGKAVEPIMLEISKLAGVDDVSRAEAKAEAARRSAGAEGAEAPDEGRPYDILDYAKTAEAATKMAAELRSVLVELNALTGGDHLPNALHKMSLSADATIENTGKQARDVVDLVFWRAVQLVGVLLLAFLVYRLLASRLKPRAAQGASV